MKKKPLSEDTLETFTAEPSGGLSTYDINLAAALLCSGLELQDIGRENPSRSLFVFRREEGLEKASKAYLMDRLKVRARSMADTLKALKSTVRID